MIYFLIKLKAVLAPGIANEILPCPKELSEYILNNILLVYLFIIIKSRFFSANIGFNYHNLCMLNVCFLRKYNVHRILNITQSPINKTVTVTTEEY